MAGYKMKSHKGAAKRFRVTPSGKVKRQMGFGSHLLTTKSAKRMRKLTTGAYCEPAEANMVKKLLPYS
jgi:large subunit ribosomal protein L35